MQTTTTTTNGTAPTLAKLPIIAPSKSAFDDALFTPGGTFDGYVRRIVKGGIRLFVMGENYTLNREDVFCLETKRADGRMWFSYGGRLNERTMGQLADLADSIRALTGFPRNRFS